MLLLLNNNRHLKICSNTMTKSIAENKMLFQFASDALAG